MSLFLPQFQIHSDLHLETPLARPSYLTFNLPIHAHNLFLLGDIGLVKDADLLTFLTNLLRTYPPLQIFCVFGNHEAYQIRHSTAIARMRIFEETCAREFGKRFHFLDRGRVDVNEKITVLGCTLWSRVDDDCASEVQARMTDFSETRGIREWTLESYLEAHATDLAWLNAQVAQIEEREPDREIVILTHHVPTKNPMTKGPMQEGITLDSAYRTDLSGEICWESERVKLWAFGHTHWNCEFLTHGKIVVANQKGYTRLEDVRKKVEVKVVEARVGGLWICVEPGPAFKELPHQSAHQASHEAIDRMGSTVAKVGTKDKKSGATKNDVKPKSILESISSGFRTSIGIDSRR